MAIKGNAGEIHELARYEVRPGSLQECLAAVRAFVAQVRANEPGALRYEAWQETDHLTGLLGQSPETRIARGESRMRKGSR